MRIPLPAIMRHWREQAHEKRITPPLQRYGIEAWAWLAKKPALYRFAMNIAMPLLAWASGGRGRFRHLPLAEGWTDNRDFPAPEGKTFMAQYKASKR